MIQPKKTFRYTTKFVISVIAMLLAACAGTESANSPVDSPSSPASPVATSSPQATTSPASATIPGVNSIDEVNFKPTSKNSPGFFDGVNGSSATKIEVSKSKPVTVGGWAILANKGRPADTVLITQGDNNLLVAVAPVNLERPDILKALKNPAFKNSGWSTTFDASTLPAGEVDIKAWVYDSATKEATQLEPIHQVVLLD